MVDELKCYRCGTSLAALSLPVSRRDACPECAASLHVCRMCRFFDPAVPKQCREDDAEEVQDKEKANFCEWFVPSPDAFDPAQAHEAARARSELTALFGEGEGEKPAEDELRRRAEDLFR
ncbi:MAG TPA: hypothetical protein VE175_12705 [Woeseiaceae bacterium]|nr:hypothetical protein [Woeseiaceae bacterium]